MSKYLALANRLKQKGDLRITLTFQEIDALCGLPASAYNHRPWWANEENGSHVQVIGWRNAGYKVEDVHMGSTVTFIKTTW